MVTETNRYANQFVEAHQEQLRSMPRSIVHQWIKQGYTHREEMRAFLGVVINMGLNKKSNVKDYWDASHESQYHPWFGDHFNRDRFLLMLKFLHFADNSGLPEPDHPDRKLYKIAPLVELLNSIFQKNYIPSKDIAIDESMVGYRGKVPKKTRAFMPNKRHARFGIKLWCLADSANGYLHTFEVFKGARTAEEARTERHGPTHSLVMRLMQKAGLLGLGHHLTLDNYFSSPQLFLDLYRKKTTCTGTVRVNRKGLPRMAIAAPLLNQEVRERRKGPLLCVVYQDVSRKCVLLSTEAAAGSGLTTNRRTGQLVRKPSVVLLYNRTMGGVDLADQQLFKYATERRTMKWTTKVAFSLLGRVLVNAYLAYKANSPSAKRISRHLFLVLATEHLASHYAPAPRVRRRRTRAEIAASATAPILPPAHPSPWAFDAGHELVRTQAGKRRACVHAEHTQRVRTRWQCSGCNLGMCPPCFINIHKRQRLH